MAAKALLLPPGSLLGLAFVGMMLGRRHYRAGRTLTLLALVTLTALSIPVVSHLLLLTLRPPAPFTANSASGAGAIIVLGGGVRLNAPEYGGDTVTALTLERVRYAALIARQTKLPVLVSGGSPQGGDAEATIMARILRDEFSVPVRWVESRSANTHENALFSAPLLRAAGIRKVVLVMHAFDMRRATAEFAAEGIEVIPAATGLPGNRPLEVLDWLPSIHALRTSYFATYELLANFVRWLRMSTYSTASIG